MVVDRDTKDQVVGDGVIRINCAVVVKRGAVPGVHFLRADVVAFEVKDGSQQLRI